MNISFNILLSVVIEHNYYKTLVDNGITIELAPGYESLLNGHGLLFKQIKGGFTILYEKTSAHDNKAKIPLPADFKLAFVLKSSNPFFINYSELPLDHKMPKVFYLSNLYNNVVDGSPLLTNQPFLGEEDQLTLQRQQFRYSATSTNHNAELKIESPKGEEVFLETVVVDADTTKFEKLISLEHLPPGHYNLYVDGELKERYYLSTQLAKQQVLGIIEIFNFGLSPQYSYTDVDGNVTPRHYKIRINRRETFWKYYVVLKSYDEDPGLELHYDDAEEDEEAYPSTLSFTATAPEPHIVSAYGDGNVLLFTSDSKLPIYESPKKNISLRVLNGNGNSNGHNAHVLLKNLPNAGTGKIVPDSGNENAFSEIFIFL